MKMYRDDDIPDSERTRPQPTEFLDDMSHAYLGSIVIGNLFSLYLYKRQSWYSAIGASGGVSGILFAAVAYAPNQIEVNFLPGYIFGALYFGYSVYMMLNPRPHDNGIPKHSTF